MSVTARETNRPAEKELVLESCPHFWLIDSATGPTSHGKCKYCGQKKAFLNSFPENMPPGNREKNLLELPEVKKVKVGGKHRDS